MDPVDSAQGRHGRVVLREHHNTVTHTNDHIGNIHSHVSNTNPLKSPGNPPIPKRNYPTSHTGPFHSASSTTSIGAQGL